MYAGAFTCHYLVSFVLPKGNDPCAYACIAGENQALRIIIDLECELFVHIPKTSWLFHVSLLNLLIKF